ncbi:MAG: phospho-sugar mutase [Clostridia bacterium]|nr:phospho-sugar mutase [Deltaproteobacteria bacterium]
MSGISDKARFWLGRDPDLSTRAEAERMIAAADEAALTEQFGTRLAFGTAGLRGLFGAGPNRMNRLVVRETSAGLAAYLLDHVREAGRRGVVIGYDGRRLSPEFAEDTASVLAGYGIIVHLFDRPVPTPVVAFAVKQYDAAAGVMITASHNPPEYNGYKVYWENGAQIIPPIDEGIALAIDKAAVQEISYREVAGARRDGLIRPFSDAQIEDYLQQVAALSVHAGDAEIRASLAIAYTPMHGVGASITEAAVKRAGFNALHTAKEQREPDGTFPTVKFPNPEEAGAMDIVLALAAKVRADVVFANDPDADRMAVALPLSDGTYRMLTGDQVGVLLGDDLMASSKMPNGVVACSIVSSRMLGFMARSRKIDFFETLTGFKWIANGAIERRGRGQNFLFGYEEALGYTVGELVRDKDGVSAIVAFAEMVAASKARGETLWARLDALYREHGVFLTLQKSIGLKPGSASIGDKLRAAPPTVIAGKKVVQTDDLRTSERHTASGITAINLPRSDVLTYFLEDDSRVIVRPSGTEPKLKCYYEVRESVKADETVATAEARARVNLSVLATTHGASL